MVYDALGVKPMKIQEAMGLTGLTRKALHFYESEGLIKPAVAGNGYRDYSLEDIALLRAIAALRRIDMPLEIVREAMAHPDRACALLRAHHATLLDRQQALAQCLAGTDRLLRRVEQGVPLDAAEVRLETLGQSLRQAFPGGFGQMLEAHFQTFLQEPLQTEVQHAAMGRMIEYLDGLEINLPDLPGESGRHAEVQQAYWDGIDSLLAMPEEEKHTMLSGMRRQKEAMDAVLAAQAPELQRELAQKSAGRKELLQEAGYYEHVVANLRVISPRYDRYLAEMERLGKLMEG